MPEHLPTFYDVPKGAREEECRGRNCRATVYWITNPATGRRLPVDCDVEGGQEPTAWADGRGVSHFTTCSDVGQFTGRNRR